MQRIFFYIENALSAVNDYCLFEKKDIYIWANEYPGGIEYAFKTLDEIIDINSPNILYRQIYDPRNGKNRGLLLKMTECINISQHSRLPMKQL